MKRRMKQLSLLLAGAALCLGVGISAIEASQSLEKNPTAGASRIFADIVKQNEESEEAMLAAKQHEEDELMLAAVTEEELMLTALSEELDESSEDVQSVGDGTEEEAVSEFADIAVAQVDNYVNVRSEPNTESEVLGKLYDKSAATVLEVTEDGWYRILSGNVEGYVKAEYVVVGDEELAKTVGTRYATVCTTTLFVRDIPSTEGKVLTMLPEGDDLVVIDEEAEGWVMVSTVEGDGYISTDYVELTMEYIHAESKEEEEARLAREEAERIAAAEAARAAREAAERAAAEEAARAAEAAKRAAEAARQSSTSAENNKSAGNNANTGNSSNAGNSNAGSSSKTENSAGAENSSNAGNNANKTSSSSNGQAVVEYAKQFLGNPYVYGGNSLTSGTDCSGFVKGVYAAFGVSLPRTSAEQRQVGYAVSLENIQPGDIVCYSGHVGIYAGNNTLIHASNERTGITYTSPVTYRPVLAVRRIF